MIINVALIEDSRPTRLYLNELFGTHYPDMKVQVEAFRVHDAIQKLIENPCDLIVLDIELPDGSGFDILQALKDQQVTDFHLILLSQHQYPDYMIQGMNYKARHYLFKPIHPKNFCAAIDLVRREIEAEQETGQPKVDQSDRLVLKLTDKSTIVLQKSLVFYAQNEKNRSLFFAEDGIWETNKHIGYYDEILAKAPYPFFRIHQSYSINLSKLKRILPTEESVLLENGVTLPIARRRLKALKAALTME